MEGIHFINLKSKIYNQKNNIQINRKVVKAISKKVDYVVVGTGPGEKKIKLVKDLNLSTLSENQLFQLIEMRSNQPLTPKTTSKFDENDISPFKSIQRFGHSKENNHQIDESPLIASKKKSRVFTEDVQLQKDKDEVSSGSDFENSNQR